MQLLLRKNFLLILLLDCILLIVSYTGSFWLRYEGAINTELEVFIMKTALPMLMCKVFSFYLFDVYRGMWRYTGINDLINVIKGAVAGTFFFIVTLVSLQMITHMSRAVLLTDFMLTVVTISGLRLGIRLYYRNSEEILLDEENGKDSCKQPQRVFIIGTGPASERLYRELNGSQAANYVISGFIDEKNQHKGMKIHGVPVLGKIDDIPQLTQKYGIDAILIASPEFKGEPLKELVESCMGQGVQFKVVPSIEDRLQDASFQNLRDICLEDLLEREPVQVDMRMVRAEIAGKTVLITGAGGSIGSELARQVLEFEPSRLVLLDNAETPLYHIDMELSKKNTYTQITPRIGDIRSRRVLNRILAETKPHIVYHAAAYKHVPLMEQNPLDAINTNILGTFKLASISCKHRVEKFIMISTDKAVKPTSIMGATKRVAEMIVQAMNGNGTSFVVVRFGNVLGSNGSVVPLFEKQIAAGGPVTVTHPEVTRYFMTIPEAVMLVLQAGAIGKGNELFLLDMGQPVRIVDLARNMIRLSGYIPDKDIKIEFVGLRPGEKLYEELLIAGEDVIDTSFEKIKICNNAKPMEDDELYKYIERFNLLIRDSSDHKAAVGLLKAMVPSYQSHIDVPPYYPDRTLHQFFDSPREKEEAVIEV